MNMKYFEALQKMVNAILDKNTREAAILELRTHMQSPGFNEHTVADLVLMAHAVGKHIPLSNEEES